MVKERKRGAKREKRVQQSRNVRRFKKSGGRREAQRDRQRQLQRLLVELEVSLSGCSFRLRAYVLKMGFRARPRKTTTGTGDRRMEKVGGESG